MNGGIPHKTIMSFIKLKKKFHLNQLVESRNRKFINKSKIKLKGMLFPFQLEDLLWKLKLMCMLISHRVVEYSNPMDEYWWIIEIF